MLTFFALHVCFFSGLALAPTILPKAGRPAFYYAYLSVILVIGGFLGNLYSLPVAEGIVVSGGNLAYGAFMLTSVIFALVERDSVIVRKILLLVALVNMLNMFLAFLITGTLSLPDTLNLHSTPTALFASSIPFIILGGFLIMAELCIMLFAFEVIKRFTQSLFVAGPAYLLVFVLVLCLDGIAYPLIAFGTSKEVIAIVVGGLSGKVLTALSYSLVILIFTLVFPERFASYLSEKLFSWRGLWSSDTEMRRAIEEKDAQISRSTSQIAHSAELAGLGYAISNRKTSKIEECDDAFAKMHGLKRADLISADIYGDMIGRIVHEDDRPKAISVQKKLTGSQSAISELRYVWPNGEIHTIRKIFSPADPMDPENDRYEVVGQDITATKTLQEQLFKSQKLDAIGKLTGGVAHDFNNLLAVTLGNLELLQDEITDSDQRELLQNSIDATIRGAELTRNMLSFARQAPLEPTVVDLNQLVRNMRNWIGRTIPSNIEVETSLLAGLWEMKVDASSTEAGLLNLLLNARDAMPNGGKLTIETSNVRIDDEYVELRGEDVEPGRYVLLAVSDNGEGISKDNLKRVFEPFYSTKPIGSGSGLGLSMIEGFMNQSKGIVRVYSEPGSGTTFKLYFRASTPAETNERPPEASLPDLNPDNRPTILLAEDSVEALKAIKATLVKHGYHVVQAISGDAAFEAFAKEPQVDLLLTDIVMPGELQGTTLAKALRKLNPELPVIFMSGYASEATVHGNGLRPEDSRLMKPVRRKDLLHAINKGLTKAGDD